MDLNQEELDDLYTLFPRYTQHEVKDVYRSSNMDFRKTCFILIRKTNKSKKIEAAHKTPTSEYVWRVNSPVFNISGCLGEFEESFKPFIIEIETLRSGDTRQ